MATTKSSGETFPALTIVDLDSFDDAESLDEITRAQLEKANRLYGGTDMKAEQILVQAEDEEVDEEGEEILRIQPDYLERGRVIDGAGHHVYDVYLYMVDSGTFFVRGSTDVVAEVIQFGIQSDDKSLEHALDQALAALRKAPELSEKKGGNPALDAYEAAVRNAMAAQDKKPAKKAKKPAAKKPAAKKPAVKKPAAKKTAAKATSAKKPATKKTTAKKTASAKKTKPVAKKAVAKKTAAKKAAPKATAGAKKPAAKKATVAKNKTSGAKVVAKKAAQKATAKKPAAKKPAAKKPAAKKPAAKKTTTRKK